MNAKVSIRYRRSSGTRHLHAPRRGLAYPRSGYREDEGKGINEVEAVFGHVSSLAGCAGIYVVRPGCRIQSVAASTSSSFQSVEAAQKAFPPSRWQEGFQFAHPKGVPPDDHAAGRAGRAECFEHTASAGLSIHGVALGLALPLSQVADDD